MPSDDQVPLLSGALGRAGDAFRSALARTIEEVRTFLDARETSEEQHVLGAQASLGAFATGRVDAERFSALLAQTLSLDETAASRVESAFKALRGLNERIDDLLTLTVPAGGSLRAAVGDRLAEIGRAFGAAHVVTAVRAEAYDESEHGGLLSGFAFERWGKAERNLAPPLVVLVAGADCKPAGLADLLDGTVKIVLCVDGPSSAAPLARLLAPRTFVVQAAGADDLEAFAAWEGPGVAALVPEGAARFRHDPAAGTAPAERLTVEHLPEEPLRAVGGISVAQQREDLELLAAWSALTPTGASADTGTDSAGKLAAWLLQQADLG